MADIRFFDAKEKKSFSIWQFEKYYIPQIISNFWNFMQYYIPISFDAKLKNTIY